MPWEGSRAVLNDEMLTINEVADYLKLKPQTIYKWAQAKILPGAKLGKEWRFLRSAVEQWVANRFKDPGVGGGAKGAGRLGDMKDGHATVGSTGAGAGGEKSAKKRRGRKKKDSGPEAN